MEQTASSPVRVGDILAQKYQVTRILAVGGMGVVVVANHMQLDQPVALKFMLPDALSSPDHVHRFLREARAAVRLRSEHVARVIDVGTLEDGAPYIVMEYLDGRDLSQVLEQRKIIALPTAVDWVLQASHAIAEAHSLGIIHRDLKPSNLFLTKLFDGSDLVKVLDFGISKTTDSGNLNMTKTTMVMGSPTYMSPEQMRSARHVDVRTDIWSLGVILFEMIAGKVPFDGENFSELVIKATLDPTPDLPGHLNISREFEAAMRRCLEKDPSKRYSNIADMAAAFAPWAPPNAQPLVERIARMLRGESTGSSQVTGLPGQESGPTHKMPSLYGERPPPPHVPGHPSTLSGVESSPFPKKKSKAMIYAGLGAVVVAIGIGVAVATGGGGGGATGQVTPASGGAPTLPTTEEVKPDLKPQETVEPKPAETKPAETVQPTETKPAETKPAETVKPTETVKPNETKPNETKPTETKPAETAKPTETKPGQTETTVKPTETVKPAETKDVDKQPAKTEDPNKVGPKKPPGKKKVRL